MNQVRRRILIVDDDAELRGLMRHTLEEAGYQLDVASTGAEAIERIDQVPPELLILDIVMPGIDGWAVIEHLHKLPRVPTVILVTTSGDSVDLKRPALRDCVAGILQKPFRYRELVTLCEDVLRNEAASAQPPQPGSERRRAPRRNLTFDVNVQSTDGSPLAVGRVAKLSPFGAELYVDAPLAPGRRIHLALILPGRPEVGVEGELLYRHARDKTFVYGVSFIDTPRPVQQAIREALGQD
jgi:DNA-binding response OmpR family regulator